MSVDAASGLANAGRQRRGGWQTPSQAVTALAELTGPITGVVHLPLSIYCSGRGPERGFDLADQSQWIELYEIVSTRGTAADQTHYLDAAELRQLWPRLRLPPAVRHTWQRLLAPAAR